MSEAKIHLVFYRYVNSQTLMISHKKWQMLHRDASLCPKWCLHNKDCDIECNHHENYPICEQNCDSVHLLYLSMESESGESEVVKQRIWKKDQWHYFSLSFFCQKNKLQNFTRIKLVCQILPAIKSIIWNLHCPLPFWLKSACCVAACRPSSPSNMIYGTLNYCCCRLTI